ncbi:MAG TPA: PHB depolymerase family esterase [Polyangiaceae bacterium]|nr:PHB depolymerase family esterase [Polyangiaceae bacterium]
MPHARWLALLSLAACSNPGGRSGSGFDVPPAPLDGAASGAPSDAAAAGADAGPSRPASQPGRDAGDAPGAANGAPDGAPSIDGARPPVATADGGPCGARTGMRGLTSRSVAVAGANRTYLVHLPSSLDPSRPAPLVLVFHGASMSGQQMHDITQYADLADSLGADGFAVAFPDGQGGPGALTPWNVADTGQSVCGAGNLVNNANAVDFAFIDAMKADIAEDQCLDAAHVFATGFSMGGYFSHHIGCERSDVRAVAPASGGTIADLSACTTGHVPIIIFHGTADGLIADGCDDPAGAPQSGFVASATLWARKNGCQDTFTTVTDDGPDGGAGQCYVYEGCPSDGQVELCTFTGMSHAWAGGSTAGQGSAFAAPSYASATQLEWAFFKKYAW